MLGVPSPPICCCKHQRTILSLQHKTKRPKGRIIKNGGQLGRGYLVARKIRVAGMREGNSRVCGFRATTRKSKGDNRLM